MCFCRQFARSVLKVDYTTLRHGFIIVSSQFICFVHKIKLLFLAFAGIIDCFFFRFQAHLAPKSQTNFDFQKYIKRSLDEDFKVVVGIRYDSNSPSCANVLLLKPCTCNFIWHVLIHVVWPPHHLYLQRRISPWNNPTCLTAYLNFHSPPIWFFAVLFLLFNTHGKETDSSSLCHSILSENT